MLEIGVCLSIGIFRRVRFKADLFKKGESIVLNHRSGRISTLLRSGIVLVIFCLPSRLWAEESSAVLEAARSVIASAGYPALITLDEQGQPRARTVDAFEPDDDFVVWVATRPVTRKIHQIKRHRLVTLYYFSAELSSYVTIMGRASIITDNVIKHTMRRAQDHEKLYPDFPDDYVLIKVAPQRLEGILPGFRGDKKTWAPVGVDFP